MLRFLSCAAALLLSHVLPTSPDRTPAGSPQMRPAAASVHPLARRGPAPAQSDYRPPLPELDVMRPFAPPRTRYGAGHLGVDLRARQSELVLAAGDGVVSFAGRVAGRGVVVVRHRDGLSTEYEPVLPGVTRGTAVQRGDPIGRVSGQHRGCPGTCLHWGARRGDTYVDPLRLLRPLAPVRLLPWPRDG